MLRSMTGYGRAASTGGDYAIEAEIRSVNGRFLKTHCKLPAQLMRFESAIEKVLRECFSRGNIEVYLKFERVSNPGGHVFNAEAARGYWQQLQELKEEFKLDGNISFELLSTLPGVLVAEEESEAEVEKVWPHIKAAIEGAAAGAARMREKEGAQLKDDLAGHLETAREFLGKLKERVPQALSDYRARFEERVGQLLEGTGIAAREQDLAREIVFYIERSDMSEELTRIASHIAQFEDIMKGGGIVGRQLEFLGQEMHREANTMGSKANDAELSNIVTGLRATVDKIREQVLNVE